MTSSLALSVSALMDHDAIVVRLVDMPFVEPSVTNLLIKTFRQQKKDLYIPTFNGNAGILYR